MRLHLPFSLRKSVLSSLVSMVALSLGSGSASAVTESEPQNLVFDGATLTWNTDTENKVFTNATGESVSFAAGDNVTFVSDASVSLRENISAGQILIDKEADVVIELNDNGLNFDTLSMQGGSLDTRAALNIGAGETLAVGANGSVLKSALVLESYSCLSVDYSGARSVTSLNNSSLSLQGDTQLQLSGCGNGDGKTYTLFTGVSELQDSQGNAISLVKGNNAISKYFDTSQPGTGFWAGARLELTNDGTLQLIRHNQVVKEAVEITARQTGGVNYQYYAGVLFENIEYVSSDSSAYGGAISVTDSGTINLSNNGSVEFIGNTVVATSSDWSSGYGGAIYAGWDCKTIKINSNGSVRFIGNSSVASEPGGSHGGAICAGAIEMNNNGIVEFIANTSSNYNGAIACDSITLSNNERVTFRKNVAQYAASAIGVSSWGESLFINNNNIVEFEDNCGGSAAIYLYHGGVDGLIADNGHVRFAGNTGGAIDIGAGSTLSINNNQDVIFEKNVIIRKGSYNLRSLWAEKSNPYNGNYCKVYLSAAAGNQIEFRDSIYIGAGSEIYLNENYTDPLYNKVHKQQGDIIFTGKYTEQHLNELLAENETGRTATAEEIRNSRTSEVHGKVTLYGGNLRIEEQAVLKTTAGLEVAAGSEATVKVSNAELDAGSSDINIGESGTLSLMNGATVRAANVNIADGATFSVGATYPQAKVATFSLQDAATAANLQQSYLVDANLTFEAGSTLVADGAHFSMAEGSTLTFNALTGGNKINLVLTLGAEYRDSEQVILFSNVDVVRFILDGVELDSTVTMLASTFFSGAWVNDKTTLSYDNTNGTITVQHLAGSIPEPTTATLSMLALAALAARRRRR